jgi:uncharacterized membrane protein YeaQ/YmgE (transglycosylase-associated protein family)
VTLLAREVARFLAGAALWIAVELIIAALMSALSVRSGVRDWRRSAGIGLVGACIAASVAVRFEFPQAWSPVIGGRPLPIVWSAVGAVLAIMTAGRLESRSAQ